LTRRPGSWAEAIKQAHGLLDQAEELNWFRGENVAVKIEAAG
jgi:hypothetical protein